MYTFIIKDNGPDMDIIITRALLALAAIAALVYRGDDYYFLNLLSFILLFFGAISMKLLLVKFRINKFILLSVAAVVLFLATHSIAFAIILMVYGYLVRFLNINPVIQVTKEGIRIKKLFTGTTYQWNEFSNIILKDDLLTLDFKNNKLIQVNIEENKTAVDEKGFNEFCKGFKEAFD